jgi:hypothetical protein
MTKRTGENADVAAALANDLRNQLARDFSGLTEADFTIAQQAIEQERKRRTESATGRDFRRKLSRMPNAEFQRRASFGDWDI